MIRFTQPKTNPTASPSSTVRLVWDQSSITSSGATRLINLPNGLAMSRAALVSNATERGNRDGA